MKPDRTVLAESSLVAIAAIWGLTFVMVQDAVAVVPVMSFLAFRFCAAALVVGVAFHRELRRLERSGWRSGLAMGGWLTAGYIFQTLGLERTSASNAGFITGMFVVLTPLFGAIFLKQKAGMPAWMAALVSTLGLLLLSGGPAGINAGDVLVFLCACSFSGHILATGRAVRDHAAGALLAVQLGVCGLFSLTVATVGGDLVWPRTADVIVALAVTAFLASAVGFFIQTYAQQHAPPARTALILASEPAFAGLFAYLLADERLDLMGWIGAALILASIVVVELLPYARRARLPEGSLPIEEAPQRP
jgi:drug/metabolite transporter (DMT)-like permease